MSIFSEFRDRFIVKPVADRVLQAVKVEGSDKPSNQPAIMQVPLTFNSSVGSNNKWQTSGGVDFPILRALSVNHETVRAAINVRKRQITQLDFDIVDLESNQDSADDTTRLAIRQQVAHIGGSGVRFREILDRLIEDILVLDTCVFYKQRTLSGKLLRIIPIDGATIKLRVDKAGARPMPPDTAFEQWIQGKKVAELTTDDLTYEMMNPRTNSPYGLSPIESLVLIIDASMRAAIYNLNYLSDNNIPPGFLSMPDGWTVNQIKEYKEWFDAMLTGSKNTSKIMPIPNGTNYQPTTKPKDFSFKDFFDYLDRKICMLFDVTPQELGLNLQQYKENADEQDKIQIRRGIRPLANFLQEIFTDIIQVELGYKNYAFKFTGLDGRFTTTELTQLIPLGVIGIDEARKDRGYGGLGVDNLVMQGGLVTPLSQFATPTVSGTQNRAGVNPNTTTPPTPASIPPLDPDVPNIADQAKIDLPTITKRVKKNAHLDKLTATPEFRSLKKAAYKGIANQIHPFTKPATIAKVLAAAKADDDPIVSEVGSLITSAAIIGLGEYLKWAATQGAKKAMRALKMPVPHGYEIDNSTYQDILGDRENYIINSVDSTTKDWIVNTIQEGKTNGLSNDQIAQQISDAYPDIAQSRADTIANTEVANASMTAELSTYSDQGVEKKMFVTSEDAEVDEECADMDGEIVGVDEPFSSGDMAPPIHPNCRCYIQAVVGDQTE